MTRILLIIGCLFFQLLSFAQVYDAELIIQETNIIISNNELTNDVYYEIRINNRAGEGYTKITIPFSKLSKVSNIEAFIKDSKGNIVKKLHKSEIVERSSIADFSFYEDDFVKEFNLKHNSYPYTIVYSYQIQQNEFLYIDNWTPVLDLEVPTRSASLKVSVPPGYNIAYKSQQVIEPTIDTLAGVINFRWHTSFTECIKPEVLSPPISDLLPSVTIVPEKFYFEKSGSFKDWILYGNWQYELLQGLNALPDNEKSKILGIIQEIDSDREKIRILYHYLQDETRYINITMETGGLKPYPASYVAQNKYGDCKALTNYFKSILDFLKIPSYYTKVYAGNPILETDKKFPSQQFNHVILYIPQHDSDIWLDCTSNGAFNHLGSFTQNREAFIVDYNNSKFIKTPVLKPSDVLDTRKIEIIYNPEAASVKLQNTYRGDSYEHILDLERSYSESEKSRIVRNFVVEKGFQLIDYQIYRLDRDTAEIKLAYNATTQNVYKHYGNDIIISNIAFSLPDFEKPALRKLPVQIDYPIYKMDTIIYEIPEGYTVNIGRDNYSLISKYGAYKLNMYKDAGNIIAIKSLLIFPGFYPISEYREFYDFYIQIIETEKKTLVSLNK